MSNQQPTGDHDATHTDPERSQSLSEVLARSAPAGLGAEAWDALRSARDLLEVRLAQIASGRFEISQWTDEDGDVYALRIWDAYPSPKSPSAPPADTLRDSAGTATETE